jgi:hexosaminidase
MLLPLPVSVVQAPGEFVLDAATSIAAPPELARTAHWLQETLRASTGLPLPVVGEPATGSIVLASRPDRGPEAFLLAVAPSGIVIEGGDDAGTFYGCQALLQLLPPAIFRKALVTGTRWAVAAQTVEDAPRFGWRGTSCPSTTCCVSSTSWRCTESTPCTCT